MSIKFKKKKKISAEDCVETDLTLNVFDKINTGRKIFERKWKIDT